MEEMAERGRGTRPMRASIYARYSSNLQSEASIEDQVRVCSERIAREGWTLVGVYSDYAISGAVRNRPNASEAEKEAAEATNDSESIAMSGKVERVGDCPG